MSTPSNYFVHTLLRARDWQDRPQFDQVCEWWRDGGRGVCALVGMGGAGKTAIAERFLNELLDDTSTTRERVSPSPSVFVYSFYDDNKPENFFRHLQIWLEGSSAPEKEKSPTQLMFDIQQRQGLIILDGLEMVQESGARGGFGCLTSPSLRELLNHLACGAARDLCVLVTSRFPLTDLRDSQPRFFQTIAIEEIDSAAGVALLRKRGVRGADIQLEPIVERCGRHALTVDLAGGYINEYGGGDPATPLNLSDGFDGTREELMQEADAEPDPNKRAVLRQGVRLACITQYYREAMFISDESALALLERICLFRLGADYETLAAIFIGPGANKVSGTALATLNKSQLKDKLNWLVQMRIVEEQEPVPSNPTRRTYNIHPAIRDGFSLGMDRGVTRLCHRVIREFLEGCIGLPPEEEAHDASLKDLLSARPSTLDLMEEVVYHAIADESGEHIEDAWKVFHKRIGGYKRLGWQLSEFARGSRICQMFAAFKDSMSESSRADFINDWGAFVHDLGQVVSAAKHYQEAARLYLRDRSNHRDAAIAHRNAANALWMQGRFSAARTSTQQAIAIDRSLSNDAGMYKTLAYDAYLAAMGGDPSAARDGFSKALDLQRRVKPGLDSLHSLYGVLHATCGARIHAGALSIVVATQAARFTKSVHGEDNLWAPMFTLLLADMTRERCDFATAREYLGSAQEQSLSRDERETLCWSWLVRARIELSEMSQASDTDACASSSCDALREGILIARDCGYGLYHIDLLLERARLHLLRGDAGAALADIKVALDTGIPANDETGQVELLAANDEECGYAWAIPPGLQLRAEAMLLQASRALGGDHFDPAEREQLPAEIRGLIATADACLNGAMERWRGLRDPEPTEDNNFVHPETGEEYNYKAAETYQVLTRLADGILTEYPLQPTAQPASEPEESAVTSKPAKVFFSYAHEDEAFKDKLTKHLAVLKRQSVIETWHDRMIAAGDEWKGAIDDNLENADIVLLLVSADFLASDYCWDVEMKRALERHEAGEARVIPIILRSADWHGAPFAKLQALPKDAKAVKEWADEDQAFTDIARGIRATIERPPSQAAASNAQQPTASGALATWQRKLAYLREHEAVESDAAAKFKLKIEIEQAEQKIRELSANP